MECYHPENNAWTDMPSMKYSRSGAGVAVLNQFIYVVGGFDGSRQLASVERFDTDRQLWETVTPMKTSRSALSVNVIDGKLYAMVSFGKFCRGLFTKFDVSLQGGYDGHSFLANVEVYDPVKDEWVDGVSLTSGRSGLASAVIYQPSCHQTLSQDCIGNISSNREYDDEKKPPDNNDDEADISSSHGPNSSYHLNCSSNFFSGSSGGQHDTEQPEDCADYSQRISGELFTMMTEMKSKLNEHCQTSNASDEKKLMLQQELSENHVVRLAKFHMKCKNHSACPLQTLKRRFRHFVSKSKCKSKCDKLGKPKG